jgi:hypothetical protein
MFLDHLCVPLDCFIQQPATSFILYPYVFNANFDLVLVQLILILTETHSDVLFTLMSFLTIRRMRRFLGSLALFPLRLVRSYSFYGQLRVYFLVLTSGFDLFI